MDSTLDLNRLYLQTPVSDDNRHTYTDINTIIKCLPRSQCVFLKNLKHVICGCNNTFAHIMGLSSGKDALNKRIVELAHPEYGKELEEAESIVFDSLSIVEDTRVANRYFKNAPPDCIGTAKIMPIYDDSEKICGVIGFAALDPYLKNIENMFHWVNGDMINALLKRKIYVLQLPIGQVCLTNRETACLLFLMKGKTAKQIARELNVSYRTIECFIVHIKEKMRCNLKSEIISLAYEYDLLKIIQKECLL